MSEVRKARQDKMNRDKAKKLMAKEIRQRHKNTSRLSQNEMFYLEQEMNKDYFPAE
jgi:hypothetical protein